MRAPKRGSLKGSAFVSEKLNREPVSDGFPSCEPGPRRAAWTLVLGPQGRSLRSNSTANARCRQVRFDELREKHPNLMRTPHDSYPRFPRPSVEQINTSERFYTPLSGERKGHLGVRIRSATEAGMIRQGSPRRREPDHELLQRVEWPVTVCRIGGWVGCLTRRRTSQPSQQEKRPSSDVVLRSGLRGLT